MRTQLVLASIALLLGALSPLASFAQVTDWNVTTDSRYDRIDQNDTGKNIQNRAQGRIRMGMTYNVGGYFEIVGLLSTMPRRGTVPADNNDFFTYLNANPGTDPADFAIRQLFIRKAFGKNNNMSLELGSFGSMNFAGGGGYAPAPQGYQLTSAHSSAQAASVLRPIR